MTSADSDGQGHDRTAARAARRERKRDQSREEILAGARRVLLRHGIGAMTLDAVANEVGMSKTGLYYYFPSKDALAFELVHGVIEAQAKAVEARVGEAADGGGALRAILGGTVDAFAPRLDDFRLAFLFGQVAGAGAIRWDREQFERIRPLNDLLFAKATDILRQEQGERPPRAAVEPRLMAFLAYLSAIGLLTMKGMVEPMDDPLLYSDEQLVEGFSRIFEAAAAPGGEG
ncbi:MULTISPECIES: TetR/AcrR family transcriptional regulator [Kaistia]|uniref:TetR/AcrR family transcriptional regulator n=1 Tax=Kaistia nematophila TaxID=2994654 RepID=A0A9X3E308_9HYPH|nr:TetR/AcrR family transcriptional regulator [Kaistia nematophila]